MTDKTSPQGNEGDSARRRVLLGHIAGAHGIRGAVLVRSYTAEPDGIASYGPLESEDGRASFVLSVEGETAKGVICRIEGCRTGRGRKGSRARRFMWRGIGCRRRKRASTTTPI